MTSFTIVKPEQHRVLAEMDLWAKSMRTSIPRVNDFTLEKSQDISRSMAQRVINHSSCDGDLELA